MMTLADRMSGTSPLAVDVPAPRAACAVVDFLQRLARDHRRWSGGPQAMATLLASARVGAIGIVASGSIAGSLSLQQAFVLHVIAA